MAKKQLTVNMIYGGSFHREGSVLNEEEIPLNLRKPAYLKEPERKRRHEEEFEEIPTDEIFEQELPADEDEDEGLELEEEPPPPPRRPIVRKKR